MTVGPRVVGWLLRMVRLIDGALDAAWRLLCRRWGHLTVDAGPCLRCGGRDA